MLIYLMKTVQLGRAIIFAEKTLHDKQGAQQVVGLNSHTPESPPPHPPKLLKLPSFNFAYVNKSHFVLRNRAINIRLVAPTLGRDFIPDPSVRGYHIVTYWCNWRRAASSTFRLIKGTNHSFAKRPRLSAYFIGAHPLTKSQSLDICL